MDERLIRVRLLDLACTAEAIALERRLVRTAGVLGAIVNSATDTAYICFDGFVTSAERLRRAIVATGFLAADPVAS